MRQRHLRKFGAVVYRSCCLRTFNGDILCIGNTSIDVISSRIFIKISKTIIDALNFLIIRIEVLNLNLRAEFIHLVSKCVDG